MRSYRDLAVWQRSMELAVECHRLSGRLRRRAPGLASRVERAAAAVPAYVAVACGRHRRANRVRRLSIARGSLPALETHVLIASRLGLLRPGELATVLALAAETRRLLGGLIDRLRAADRGDA